jgi:hypothetical protein
MLMVLIQCARCRCSSSCHSRPPASRHEQTLQRVSEKLALEYRSHPMGRIIIPIVHSTCIPAPIAMEYFVSRSWPSIPGSKISVTFLTRAVQDVIHCAVNEKSLYSPLHFFAGARSQKLHINGWRYISDSRYRLPCTDSNRAVAMSTLHLTT